MGKSRSVKVTHGTPAFQPLYRQIKSLITQSLISGEWGPGSVIPSEIDLARRYAVSQGTVRKAINELAAENLLVRHQGKGTFVSSHTEETRRYYFTRIAPDRGERALPVPELLEFRRGKADARTAARLGVGGGTTLLVLKRLLRAAGRPVILETSRLPAGLFRGLTAEVLAQRGALLYSTFEEVLGIRVLKAEESIKAVRADAEAAARLGVEEGSPLLSVERVALTYGDRPVELRRSLCHTRDFHYRARIL
jgi:GntR family transcriptional regulator